MSQELKSLLGSTSPLQPIVISKSASAFESKDVHKMLISAGVVPLRGTFNSLTSMLNTLNSVQIMVRPGTPICIMIDDDNLTKDETMSLKAIVQNRAHGEVALSEHTRIMVVTDRPLAELKAVFGGLAIYPGKPQGLNSGRHVAYGQNVI